jgi:hypothetical protein
MMAACSLMIISPAPTQAQEGSFEQASADFVKRYLEEWSRPAPDALAYMDQVYPDEVYFYGKELSHTALMNLKRKAATRWPTRTLSLRPNSIQVVCDPTHLCTVEASYDWHYRSPERQAGSSGSASLKLKLQDGMTVLSEDGSTIPSEGSIPSTGIQRPPLAPVTVQPLLTRRPLPAETPMAPIAEASPPPEDISPQWRETRPSPDSIAAMRNEYVAHSSDKDWMTSWLAQRQDFSGEAIVVGTTEDQVGPGAAGVLRTTGFTSAAGTVACVNPDDATALKVGEKVSLHGVITVFIEDVMYLGQCSIQPG